MKEKFRKIFSFLKCPNIMFTCFSYALFIALAILSIIMLNTNASSIAKIIIYAALGITFFYSIFLLVSRDFKIIKNFFKAKASSVSGKNKFLNRYVSDVYFRTMFTSTVSMIICLGFACYNAFAGLYYHSVWNGSISVYFMFLVLIRLFVLIGEFILHKKSPETDIELKRAKLFKIEGILLICLDIALIAPVTILAMSKKEVSLPAWVAIAGAAYTFYKVISCVVSFIKTRKNNILSIKGLKNINLTDAMVSMLSLENTMILTFSDGTDYSMFTLVAISALVVMVLCVSIAVTTLLKGTRHIKLLKHKNLGEEKSA